MAFDMEKFEREAEADRQAKPQAVACHRGKTYDAEIMFGGKQYLVGAQFATREDAMKAAQAHCTNIREMMLVTARQYINTQKWREAKP